ncbi:MAG TPA: carboxypeptidase-like regulatory domain-containing protein [Microlunatus sp.]
MIINGLVADPSGHPVSGAVVLVVESPQPVPDIAALTGEDGRFSIVVPVPGDYRLVVRRDTGTSDVAAHVTPAGADVGVVVSG